MNASEAYALWAPTYHPRPHNALMEVEQEALLASLPAIAGRIALDAGCGTGRYLQRLRAMGAAYVLGCDRSAEMLARAAGAGLVRADLRALPLASASIDVVVCGLVLNDLDDLQPAIDELARVLKPGGSLVASLLHPRGAAEGWRRTFETRDGTREVQACWHSLNDVRRACAQARMPVVDVLEPALDGSGPVALVMRALVEATPSWGGLP